jgi:hypothetical protein
MLETDQSTPINPNSLDVIAQNGPKTRIQLAALLINKLKEDMGRDGFTYTRRSEIETWVTEYRHMEADYINGDNLYTASFNAIKDIPQQPEPYVSRLHISFDVEEDINLTELNEGEKRKISLWMEHYPATPEDIGSDFLRAEQGSIHIWKITKTKDGSGSVDDLGEEAGNQFMRVLLLMQVDRNRTTKRFHETETKAIDYRFLGINEVFWNSTPS